MSQSTVIRPSCHDAGRLHSPKIATRFNMSIAIEAPHSSH